MVPAPGGARGAAVVRVRQRRPSTSALHLALRHGYPDVCAALLARGDFPLDARDPRGETVLPASMLRIQK